MSDKIYGIKAVLTLFKEHGAMLSRTAFNEQILPRLGDFAEKHGERSWAFDRRYMVHWAEYVAEVQKRRADGRLVYHYPYSEGDMQNFIDGAWDE